jgi:hypothetical protein
LQRCVAGPTLLYTTKQRKSLFCGSEFVLKFIRVAGKKEKFRSAMMRCWQQRPNHLAPFDWIEFTLLFTAKFVLEVLGASGAIWGFSEVLLLRDSSKNNEIWRIIALVVGGIFLYRFWLHVHHYLEHDYEFPPIKMHHRHHKKPFLQMFSSKLVLQVFGGGASVWGCSEAIGWRTPQTLELWRPVAIAVATLFGIQWILEMIIYCKAADHVENIAAVRWYKVLLHKFVLEVLGGAGAIWGSAEVLTLRNDDTVWFWRPVTLGFGVIFLIRWLRLIQDELQRNARHARQVEQKEEEEVETTDLVLTVTSE